MRRRVRTADMSATASATASSSTASRGAFDLAFVASSWRRWFKKWFKLLKRGPTSNGLFELLGSSARARLQLHHRDTLDRIRARL